MKELCAMKSLKCDFFSDTLDGYFPLSVSVQQMMERNAFDSVWFMLRYAPFVDVPGLSDKDTVPFSLRNQLSGLFEAMALTGSFSDGGFSLVGSGDWFREEELKSNRPLTGRVRLGEPAYITGFGISSNGKDKTDLRSTVVLAEFTTSTPSDSSLRVAADQLGWKAAHAHCLGFSRETLILVPETKSSQVAGREQNPFVTILRGDWSHILTETKTRP